MSNSSLYDLTYTYHFSKYSCFKEFYLIHLLSSYVLFLSGVACFITRLHEKINFLHKFFGKLYILSMLFATASSLLIHNTGLPLPILVSFSFVLAGLTIGWVLIQFHKPKERSNLNKLFSIKTLHGIFMFLSWFNISGRVFVTPFSDFTCHTYLVYKPINTTIGPTAFMNLESKPLQLVPEEDPDYNILPWAGREVLWSVALILGPVVFAFIFATIYIYSETLTYYLCYICNLKKIKH